MKICTINGCERPLHARGLCHAHYWKLSIYGSPDSGKNYRPAGERLAFIDLAIKSDQQECILWPFSHNGNGYPSFSQGKKKRYAHRVVCEAANGPHPKARRFVAHSCGNGGKGCINPKHVRWATAAENAADKVLHGTQLSGESMPSAKLTEAEAIAISQLRGVGSCRVVGLQFGVKAQTIHDIWSGATWRRVTGIEARK